MHTFMEHTCLSKLLTCNQVPGARAVLHYGIIPTFPRSIFLHLGIGEICIAGVLVVLSFVVGVFSNYTCVGDVAAANNGVQYGSKLRVNLYESFEFAETSPYLTCANSFKQCRCRLGVESQIKI